MDNKKRIVNLEYFKEMLHICPRLPGQTFNGLLFEEEILAFLRFLKHSGEIRKLTDVNINKLHQPWRSFAAVINKCLVGNVQFGAMLLVELTNEDIKNSEAYKEYYAIALGAAPPKTKASVRKTKSSSDTTITPPTIAGIRISTSAKGKQPAKSSKEKGLTVLSEVAMTKAKQMKLAMIRSMQKTHISQASGSGADEGTGSIPRVLDVPTDESDEEISWKSSDDDELDERSDDQDDDDDDDQYDDDQDDNDNDQDTDNDGDNFVHPKLSIHEKEAKDEESFDPIVQTPKNYDDEGNDNASLGMNVGGEEGHDAEDDDEELYIDVNINLEGRDVQMIDVHITQEFEDTHVTLTPVNPDGQQQIALTAPTLPPLTIPTISQVTQAPTPPTITPSTFLQDLPNFGSLFGFDHRLKTLEVNFSKFVQTNQFAGAVSFIPGIVKRYMDQRMNEAIKIIKEKIKEQVKVQVSKILPNIKKTMNEQLEAKVLTRSSNSSNTSYAVAADLSEMELKKILIEKMESNKSIHRSDEQRNLYKALVDAYECNKILLYTYRDTVTLKRRRDDADKDEEPSAGSDQGFKRRREGKEAESTSAPKEKATKTFGKSTQGSKSYHKTASESAPAGEPMQTTQDLEEPSHQEFKTGDADDQPIAEASQQPECDLAKQAYSRSSFNEPMDTHVDFSAFLMNRLKVDTLTPKLLAGPTYELMKGLCKSLVELEFFLKEPLPLIPNSQGRRVISFDHFLNNDLEYLRGGASNRKYTTSVTKTKAAYYGHIKWIEDLVPRTMWSQEPVGYDKYALWGISHWGSLNGMITSIWIGSRLRKANKSHGRRTLSFQRLSKNVYKKHRHSTTYEKSSTRCRKLLKKLNLTKPNTYHFNLKHKKSYTAYSNPRGFIYQNKDKQNRLMQINELHKFSDGTLNDVRTPLDDCLKGIRMKYLPRAIWRKSDKERAAAMIQAIDKKLKMRRIMRSLEKFVGGRLYEGDFRMLQRTI
nr:hypothetical protein [Tanacetum cinerariifolium]